MNWYSEDDKLFRRYLLDDVTAQERRLIEGKLLSVDQSTASVDSDELDFVDRLLLAEDELIDDYACGVLSERERGLFDANFQLHPERRQKLLIAEQIAGYAADTKFDSEKEKPELTERTVIASKIDWLRKLLFPGWKVFVYASVILIVGLGIWRLLPGSSELTKGEAALRRAYQDQRPLEARISNFDYAFFSNVRGGPGEDAARETFDPVARNLAERIFLDEVASHPSPQAHYSLGRLYLTKKAFADAVKEFELALRDDPNNADLCNDLGVAYLELGRKKQLGNEPGGGMLEFGKAIEQFTTALRLNGQLNAALFNRALCQEQMELNSQAEKDWTEFLKKDSSSKWADEAKEHLRLLEERKKRAGQFQETLWQSFVVAYEQKDSEGAWDSFAKARGRLGNAITERLLDAYFDSLEKGNVVAANDEIKKLSFLGGIESQKTGDRYTLDLANYYRRLSSGDGEIVGQARKLMDEAADFYNQSEFERSIGCYARAKSLFEKVGNQCEAEMAESWMGYEYARLADWAKCVELFKKLNRRFIQKGHKGLHAYGLNAVADAYTSKDEFSRVIEFANQSMQIARGLGDVSGILRNLNALQSMNWHLGKYDECLQLGSEALRLTNPETLDPKQVWPFYNLISLSFLTLGKPEAALVTQKEALQISEKARWPMIRALSHAHLGLIYAKLNAGREAVQHGQLSIQEGQHITGEATRQNLLAGSQMYLGWLNLAAGNFADAITSYDQAIPLCEKVDAQFYLFSAHRGKFETCLATGNIDCADRELKAALDLIRQYRSKIVEESNRNKFFDLGQDVYDDAIDFEFSKRRNSTIAFQYSEESKARSLLDARQTGAKVVKAEKEIELKLPQTVNQLDLASIQSRLPEMTAIVQYAVLPEKLIIWFVSPNGVIEAEKAIRAIDLEAKVTVYLRLLLSQDDSQQADANKKANELYELLISPVLSHLGGMNLVCLVPDKSLYQLPFSSLRSPETGRYLVEDLTTVIAPSSTTFILCSEAATQRRGNKSESLLSIGDPLIDYSRYPELSAIDTSKDEAERIAAFYATRRVLVKADADEEKVSRLLNTADVIHLAGHSVVNETIPLLSGFPMARSVQGQNAIKAGDGFLHAYELYQLNLTRPRLVVLSACRTGSGRIYKGEGAISITRPFLAAGIPVVVSSLWNVESSMTTELMVDFHRQRKVMQLPTALALRSAQLEMLHSTPIRHRKPAAWAAFVAIGGQTGY